MILGIILGIILVVFGIISVVFGIIRLIKDKEYGVVFRSISIMLLGSLYAFFGVEILLFVLK